MLPLYSCIAVVWQPTKVCPRSCTSLFHVWGTVAYSISSTRIIYQDTLLQYVVYDLLLIQSFPLSVATTKAKMKPYLFLDTSPLYFTLTQLNSKWKRDAAELNLKQSTTITLYYDMPSNSKPKTSATTVSADLKTGKHVGGS